MSKKLSGNDDDHYDLAHSFLFVHFLFLQKLVELRRPEKE